MNLLPLLRMLCYVFLAPVSLKYKGQILLVERSQMAKEKMVSSVVNPEQCMYVCTFEMDMYRGGVVGKRMLRLEMPGRPKTV